MRRTVFAVIAAIFFVIVVGVLSYSAYLTFFSKGFEFSFEPKRKTNFYQKPHFLGKVVLKKRGPELIPGLELIPGSLYCDGRVLYVSFLNSSRIEAFDLEEKEKKAYDLSSNPAIGSLAANKDDIYLTDNNTREIVFVEKKDLKEKRYGWLPGNKGTLDPKGIHWFKGNVYVSDGNLKAVLIISTESKGKIKERGELILTAPSSFERGNEKYKLSSPGGVLVTPDGRIIAADGDKVMVYTCVGNFAYRFPGEKNLKGAVDVDYDLVFQPKPPTDPKISQDILKTVGRIHILDKKAGRVVVFNPFADTKLFTYGENEKLQEPSSIAICRDLRLIFIADTGNQRIVVYGY